MNLELPGTPTGATATVTIAEGAPSLQLQNLMNDMGGGTVVCGTVVWGTVVWHGSA